MSKAVKPIRRTFKSTIRGLRRFDPVGQTIADTVGGASKYLDPAHVYAREGEPGHKDFESDQLKAQLAIANQAPTPEERGKQMETREAELIERQRAAGAIDTENEADLLGYNPKPKRRSASRTLLG